MEWRTKHDHLCTYGGEKSTLKNRLTVPKCSQGSVPVPRSVPSHFLEQGTLAGREAMQFHLRQIGNARKDEKWGAFLHNCENFAKRPISFLLPFFLPLLFPLSQKSILEGEDAVKTGFEPRGLIEAMRKMSQSDAFFNELETLDWMQPV